jgi:hypothetical protein
VRHLLPIIPLMYMLAAGTWRKWTLNMQIGVANGQPLATAFRAVRSVALAWLKLSVLVALLIWLLLETLAAAPHYISYFNQAGGGVKGGYRYVTDSNYDWGQDLLRLRDFMNQHPEIDRMALDYFGSWGAPAYYLGDRKVDWWSAKGDPREEGVEWLAVSVNSLQSAIHPTSEDFFRKSEDSYAWLTALRQPEPGMGSVPQPDFRVGKTIFVYKL